MVYIPSAAKLAQLRQQRVPPPVADNMVTGSLDRFQPPAVYTPPKVPATTIGGPGGYQLGNIAAQPGGYQQSPATGMTASQQNSGINPETGLVWGRAPGASGTKAWNYMQQNPTLNPQTGLTWGQPPAVYTSVKPPPGFDGRATSPGGPGGYQVGNIGAQPTTAEIMNPNPNVAQQAPNFPPYAIRPAYPGYGKGGGFSSPQIPPQYAQPTGQDQSQAFQTQLVPEFEQRYELPQPQIMPIRQPFGGKGGGTPQVPVLANPNFTPNFTGSTNYRQQFTPYSPPQNIPSQPQYGGFGGKGGGQGFGGKGGRGAYGGGR